MITWFINKKFKTRWLLVLNHLRNVDHIQLFRFQFRSSISNFEDIASVLRILPKDKYLQNSSWIICSWQILDEKSYGVVWSSGLVGSTTGWLASHHKFTMSNLVHSFLTYIHERSTDEKLYVSWASNQWIIGCWQN